MKSRLLVPLCVQTRKASTMRAWHLDSYDGKLTCCRNAKIPAIRLPTDVLVKVEASSINPLDVMMANGYGRTFLNELRTKSGQDPGKSGDFLPLILGRDFSGTVVDQGMSVKDFKVGDKVWGALSPTSPGTFAEYVVASSLTITRTPDNVSHTEAAALPYVGLTSWSAITLTAGLSSQHLNQNAKFKILLIGASGGVGTFAVQLLKAWNYPVVAVSRNFDLVERLGADVVLDYTEPDYWDAVKKLSPFDVVLDFASGPIKDEPDKRMAGYLRPWSGSKIVSLTSPLMRSSDEKGVLIGSLQTVANLLSSNAQAFTSSGNTYRYGYFMPNPIALRAIKKLVESQKIRPIVQEVVPIGNLPSAFETASKGSLRGKIVIDNEAWNGVQ